jgi:predicted signal transduction protein with EAL and GGDEF domain
MSVSIGVATMPTHATDKESLLREADDAVYNAKNGGKNRVRAAWGPSLSVAQDANAEEVAPADEWTGE